MSKHRLLVAALALCIAAPAAAQQKFTDWGWPQPYEKVSEKSVQWLQQKGWWPVQVAFQPPWSGQNTTNIVMDRQGLLKSRGVEAKWQGFPSGPAINETIVSAKFQVGNGGSTGSLLSTQITNNATLIAVNGLADKLDRAIIKHKEKSLGHRHDGAPLKHRAAS